MEVNSLFYLSAFLSSFYSKKIVTMGILNFRNKKKKEDREFVELDGLRFNTASFYSSNQSMRLSAVYAAVNQISNSCAMLPMSVIKTDGMNKEYIEHPLNFVLNYKPDQNLTHYTWMKKMIESVMLTGNAYAYIVRDENLNVKELRYLPTEMVTPTIVGGTVKYIVSGIAAAVDAINMIHLYQHCDEMMNGISIIKYATMCLKGATQAERHSDNFFKSGANLSGILKASAPLTNEQKKQIKESWNSAFTNNGDTSSVAVLPAGLEYQAISVSPEDSQSLESRKYNVVEIARFFNISPLKLFDLSNSNFANMEAAQLNYLQDTIYPYTRMLADEFNLKLFKPSEVGKLQISFDFTSAMEVNKETEASYYKSLLNNGILSLNEVRIKLGYNPVPDGDKHYMQLSFTTVDNINSGVLTKNQTQEQVEGSDQLDNKVKGNKKTK